MLKKMLKNKNEIKAQVASKGYAISWHHDVFGNTRGPGPSHGSCYAVLLLMHELGGRCSRAAASMMLFLNFVLQHVWRREVVAYMLTSLAERSKALAVSQMRHVLII